MPILFLHALFGAVLFGAVLADVFFLRSKGSLVFEPKEAMDSWRKYVAYLQMGAFLIVFGLGLAQWIPNMRGYAPQIFHTKALLAVAFLILAKVRIFVERKKQRPSLFITRILFILVFLLFSLGLSSSNGLF